MHCVNFFLSGSFEDMGKSSLTYRLLYKKGQDFLDTLYVLLDFFCARLFSEHNVKVFTKNSLNIETTSEVYFVNIKAK